MRMYCTLYVYQAIVSILGQIQKLKIEKKCNGIAVDDLAKVYSTVYSQAILIWPGGLNRLKSILFSQTHQKEYMKFKKIIEVVI